MAGSPVPLLARRFLLSKASDRFLSFIAWVSVTGVALGVLALVAVTSVINGFETELIRAITGMNGDVILYSRADPIRDPDQVEERIKRALPEIKAITRSFISELMVSGPSGVAGSILEGIERSTFADVTDVAKRVVSGRLPEADDEIVLGSALADRIGAETGTEVRLIIPFAGEEAEGPQSVGRDDARPPKIVKARVSGIVRMGMYDYDSKYVFSTLEAVQKIIDRPGEVTAFKLRLMPDSDPIKAAQVLSENFGNPYRAKDWSQFNKNLLYAIRLEKAVIAVILAVIIIVAAFNVVSTLMMMIHDKTKEVAILKAMGLRRSQSFALFCMIGMGIGVVGTSLGVVSGLGVNKLLEKVRWIDLPAEIYNVGKFPIVVRWMEVGLISFLALVITFFATIYPAIQVSNRSPLDGIRYD